VRPGVDVVVFPGRQHGTRLRERGEQRLVEEFVAEPGVEALDECILGRFAGRDVVPVDLLLLAKAQHGHSGQLGAVIGHAHCWPTAPGDDDFQFAYDPQAGQRGVGDERQALAGEVIDHGQNAETPTIGEGIRQEIGNRGSSAGWFPAGSPAAPRCQVPVCACRAGETAAAPRDRDDETSCGS
jgi:hypothetical protein